MYFPLAGDLVKATTKGDNTRAEVINSRLYKNAEEIAHLLDTINPYWHYENWRKMLFKHLDLAKLMAKQMINGKYKESINIYDTFEKEVMIMADVMAKGLLRQFPLYVNLMTPK